MRLVAGVDSSTQSCKVVVCDVETGQVVRSGAASHPPGSEVDPEAWWSALLSAIEGAGGVEDVEAMSVAGQQHGLVALDEHGGVLRPALLWNDTRSAPSAADLVVDLGRLVGSDGASAWASRTGSVPVASYTVTKLRWLADNEPDTAARVAAIALPHDWLTWRLSGGTDVTALATDRSDASGTGYYDPVRDEYDREILDLALRRSTSDLVLPRVLGPAVAAGAVGAGVIGAVAVGAAAAVSGRPMLAGGCGDNAGAALGLGMTAGDVTVSVGTSGVVSVVSDVASCDPEGLVAGFADATGRYLPLVCTMNAAQVLDATAALLGVGHAELASLALAAPAGAGGCVLVPYLEGERTPNLPDARGSFHGLSLTSMTRENVARAAFEGVVCGLANGLDLISRQGASIERIRLVGGAARSEALPAVLSAVLGRPVEVPEPREYVAVGAARQAAWSLLGGDAPPDWDSGSAVVVESKPSPEVMERYAAAAALVASSVASSVVTA